MWKSTALIVSAWVIISGSMWLTPHKKAMLVSVVLYSLLMRYVLGYSNGPPPGTCGDMTPGHGAQIQARPAPYKISFSKATYAPNEDIQVTLKGVDGNQFQGFFIEPRQNSNSFTTFGTISNFPAETHNPCENQITAVSHSNAEERSLIQFTWTAPSSNVGNIIFFYTVVKSKSVYWVKLASDALAFSDNNPSGGPANGDLSKPPNQAPSSSTVGALLRDASCGISFSCFPNPSQCSTNCDYLIMWQDTPRADSVIFVLKKKITSTQNYIAIGFSQDPIMGDDSVVACYLSKNGVVKIISAYNNMQKGNEPLEDVDFGVILNSDSYRDGILTCSFQRKKSALLAGDFNASPKYFDLVEEFFLLVAFGLTENGKRYNYQAPHVWNKLPFDLRHKSIASAFKSSLKTVIVKKKECGDTLGCFHDCDADNICTFMLTWKDNGNDVDLTLTCKRPNNEYCAVGLSSDEKMGDDSVFECISSDNMAYLYSSYNLEGVGKENQRLTDSQFGMTVLNTYYTDGILTCSFSRKKTVALAMESMSFRHKRFVSANTKTYKDMNRDWILMYAYGGTSIGDYISKHTVVPIVSTQKADFQSFDDIGTKAVDNKLVKSHGIIMTLAWLLFATSGIFMARFYKTVWPEGMEWFGKKRWFVIHRGFMVIAVLLTIMSFIMIFAKVGKFSEINGSTYEKSHPVIGIIITGLAVINPLMALIRPDPGTPRRFIFNVAHTFVGVAAHVCSVVNIFSGVLLAAAQVPLRVHIVLWIYVGWIAFVEVSMFMYEWLKKKGEDEGLSPILGYKSKQSEMYQLRDVTNIVQSKGLKVQTPKVVVLGLHLVTLLALSIAVCVIISQAEHRHEQ